MPTEIRFYHLTRTVLDEALAKLLSMTLARGKRALVRVGNEARLKMLDERLWTLDPNSFIPHATAEEPEPERQPVFLTRGTTAPNGATYLFLVDGATPSDLGSFERVMLLFDSADSDLLAETRTQWKALQAEGQALSYWQEAPGGGWQQRA